jgi:hypothetical protein
LQGTPEHRDLQLKLCQLGRLRQLHVDTNRDIGARVRCKRSRCLT